MTRRTRTQLAALVAAWALLAVVQAARIYLFSLVHGQGVALRQVVEGELVVHGLWALLTPGVLSIAAAFPPARRWNLPVHAASACGFAVVHLALVHAAVAAGVENPFVTGLPPAGGPRFVRGLLLAAALEVALYAAIVAAWQLAQAWAVARERALRSAQLDARLAHAQLDTLRSRVQPHFLFNTLHAVSSLMASDVVAARRMLADLSDLLRLSLDAGQPHEVPLRDELAALVRYVDIQRTRFRGQLRVDIHVEPEAAEARVPRLILQPLVESALENGVSPRGAPGHVDVRAWVEGHALRLAVSDDGAGAPRGSARDHEGVHAARERLREMYGSGHELNTRANPAGGVTVNVTIPLEPAARPDGELALEP